MLAIYMFTVSICGLVCNGVDILRGTTGCSQVNTHIANVHYKKEKPTEINVLKLRILFNIFKIFKIKKNETHIVLNIVTTL